MSLPTATCVLLGNSRRNVRAVTSPDVIVLYSHVRCVVAGVNAQHGCMQPSERIRQLNKERFDVLSVPNCVIKKNPSD